MAGLFTSSWTVQVAVALFTLPALLMADGLNADSCVAQSKCLDITYGTTAGSPCGGSCAHYVCVTFNSEKEGCPKLGGAFKDACLPQSAASCPSVGTSQAVDFARADAVVAKTGFKNFKQCFNIRPGELIQFILRDGETCYSGLGDEVARLLTGAPPATSISCGAMSSSGSTCCVGGGECVWTLTMPSTPVCTPAGGVDGAVWLDINSNGLQEPLEAGQPGVPVKLLQGTTVISTTTTNSNGQYSFSNVVPGLYTVQFTKPSGFDYSVPNQGSNEAIDSDVTNIATGQTSPFTVVAGAINHDVDAGLVMPVGGVSGAVWVDGNDNGLQEVGEAGLSGVPVKLLQGTTVVATTTTASNGQYSFVGVEPGSYIVQFQKPSAYDFTPLSNQGSDDTIDSDVINTATGVTGPITVSAGQNTGDVDAGVVASGINPNEDDCICPPALRTKECNDVESALTGQISVTIPNCDMEKLLAAVEKYGCKRPVEGCDTITCDTNVPADAYTTACSPVYVL